MSKANDIESGYRNTEGYVDTTAYNVIKAMAINNKAYHVFETCMNVARIGGFEIMGTIMLKDKNGDMHDGAQLRLQKRKNVQKLSEVREDP